MGGRGGAAIRNAPSTKELQDEFNGALGKRGSVNIEKKMATLLEGQLYRVEVRKH